MRLNIAVFKLNRAPYGTELLAADTYEVQFQRSEKEHV